MEDDGPFRDTYRDVDKEHNHFLVIQGFFNTFKYFFDNVNLFSSDNNFFFRHDLHFANFSNGSTNLYARHFRLRARTFILNLGLFMHDNTHFANDTRNVRLLDANFGNHDYLDEDGLYTPRYKFVTFRLTLYDNNYEDHVLHSYSVPNRQVKDLVIRGRP